MRTKKKNLQSDKLNNLRINYIHCIPCIMLNCYHYFELENILYITHTLVRTAFLIKYHKIFLVIYYIRMFIIWISVSRNI